MKTPRLCQDAINPISTGSEKSNLAEARDRDFKVAIMIMFNDCKEGMSNALMKTVKMQTMVE